jgi:GrpB-like predicted nucleotidyltransferase (UPF0157 family)
VIHDCVEHGRLAERHSTASLRRALATLPADVVAYSNCKVVIKRAIDDRTTTGRRRPAGPDRVAAVYRDCAGAGSLKHRFAVRTLRRALRHMPADVKDYTQCSKLVRAELAKRGRRVTVPRRGAARRDRG